MKKVYLIYAKIPALLFDNKLHDFVYDSYKYKLSNGYYIGLYAWTTNKILLDTFIDFRKGANKIYKLVTKKFDKEDFIIFRQENFHEELSYYRFSSESSYYEIDDFNTGWEPSKTDEDKNEFFEDNKNLFRIVCTKCEYVKIAEDSTQYLADYLSQIINVEYSIFAHKYLQALDSVGYCDEFNRINYDIDDDLYDQRGSSTDYNNSFELSYYGNHMVDFYRNQIALFINIYYEMIVGYNPNETIKLLIID